MTLIFTWDKQSIVYITRSAFLSLHFGSASSLINVNQCSEFDKLSQTLERQRHVIRFLPFSRFPFTH